MAEFHLKRLEIIQPVIGSDPQLYVYNATLADESESDIRTFQNTSEYPDQLTPMEICTWLRNAVDPDTYDDPLCE